MKDPNVAYISLTYLATIYRNDDETLEEFQERVDESIAEVERMSHPYSLNDIEIDFMEAH